MTEYIPQQTKELSDEQKHRIVCSFIQRTYYNLEQYEKERKKEISSKEKNYQFEVTQILNSFLGLVALPQQQMESLIKEIDISNLKKNIKKGKKTPEEVFRHLRNAIAHGHFLEDMELDDQHNIQSITFRDYEYKNHERGKKNFEIVLSIKEILDLIDEVYLQSKKFHDNSTL